MALEQRVIDVLSGSLIQRWRCDDVLESAFVVVGIAPST